MATVHVYVRTQVTGSSEDVHVVAGAVEVLRDAVEAAGGDWCGSAQISDDEPAVSAAPKAKVAPAAPTDGGVVVTSHRAKSEASKKK